MKEPLMLCVPFLGPIIMLSESMWGHRYLGLWQGLVPMSLLLLCDPLGVSSCLRLGSCL